MKASWVAAALAGLLAQEAGAVLGEPMGQGPGPAAASPVQRRALAMSPGVHVHERMRPDGSSVREFTGPDGIVFAVAWRTRLKPDLHELLGRYRADYAEAAARAMQEHPGLRRSVALRQGDLLVQSHGHLDAFAGRAVLLSRVPASLPVDEIR